MNLAVFFNRSRKKVTQRVLHNPRSAKAQRIIQFTEIFYCLHKKIKISNNYIISYFTGLKYIVNLTRLLIVC